MFGQQNYEDEKNGYSGTSAFTKMTEFININLPNVVRHLPAVAKSNEEYEKNAKRNFRIRKK